MAKYQGGMIGSLANNPDGTNYTGKANGVFSLPQQIVNKRSSLWAIGQTKPNPPTIGTATGAGTTSISVAFIPPVQNGGSTITSYTVTSSSGHITTGTSSPIIVSGLTNGTSYTFTVTATNALGVSVSSATSNSTTPAITDPYFSSVVLLLKGDSASIVDSSSYASGISNLGAVTRTTSIVKTGTGALSFPGTSTSMLTLSNAAFALAAGDNYTIEFWIYKRSTSSNWQCTIATRNSGSGYWLGFAGGTNNPIDYTAGLSSNISVVLNTWTHIAYVRNSGQLTVYVNGNSGGTTSNASAFSNTTLNIGMEGGSYQSQTFFTDCVLDDIRITKGIARYTTNFTPPTASFPTL
jgi:hypothetical protein